MDFVAIRGATTVDFDTKEQIESASIELYDEILRQNSLTQEDIIYIQLSSTVDLVSYYPATAIRLNGCNAPLFSSTEPNIVGSLNKCIRMLVLCKSAKTANHVYLKNAKNLKK